MVGAAGVRPNGIKREASIGVKKRAETLLARAGVVNSDLLDSATNYARHQGAKKALNETNLRCDGLCAVAFRPRSINFIGIDAAPPRACSLAGNPQRYFALGGD
jgi:hypothetical protein